MIASPPVASQIRCLVACVVLSLLQPICPAAGPDTPSLASRIPGGAYAYIETSSLAKLIGDARGSELLEGVLNSEDFAELRERKWYKEFDSSRKLAEFVLRMNLWEASAKLLGGRVGIAVYPAGDAGDPEVALLVRPAEPSAWLKRRVWSAPLLRIGLKRIGRIAFGSGIAAYRTRGRQDKATYFALHDDWIAAASTDDLLKKTVLLQTPGDVLLGDPGTAIGDELPYQEMTKRMGAAHIGRVFIDTRRVAERARKEGPNLGLPDHPNDPMLSLFFGGLTELIENSRFAGLVLDLEGNQLRLSAGIDARPDEVDERYRIFFSDNPSTSMEPLPEVAGLIGGFTLYRQFGNWYRNRGDVIRDSIIPGIEGFQGDVGDVLLGETDADGKSLIGDRVAFIAAMRDDAGSEPNGAALPGFAFVVDLDKTEDADASVAAIFKAVLEELHRGREQPFEWEHGQGAHLDVMVKFAMAKSGDRALVPAIARVGDQLIVSSSRQLCHDLISHLSQSGRHRDDRRDLVFQLHSKPLERLLETNRKQYFGQLVRDGRSSKQALDDLKHIGNVLATFSSLEGSSTAANGIFKMDLHGQLK